MSDLPIPFQSIDWSQVAKTEHTGDTGTAWWQTIQLPGLRIRLVKYSANYVADHWCELGHIVHCLNGEFTSEEQGGKSTTLQAGMSYVVSDKMNSHRSVTVPGATLLIIDGDFLNRKVID